jgi:hypothetical protein
MRGGTGVRESEHPIVPVKQGQLTERSLASNPLGPPGNVLAWSRDPVNPEMST